MPRIVNEAPFDRLGWLSDTPAEFRAEVIARSDALQFPAGSALYQVGDNGGALFGVAEGRVEVHVRPLGDTPTLIHVVGPGFWTGEFGAVLGQPRIISLVARSDTRILRLTRATLLRLAEGNPEIWQKVTALAMRNQVALVNVLSAVRCDDPVQRVALVLVNLSGEPSPQPGCIDILQPEIGAIARMSRGSVNAALAALEAQGLIRRVYRAIEVTDAAALVAFAERG